MPRDYKHRATRKRKRSKLSPWLLVISGLLVGLFIAFLVFIKMQTPPEPPAFFQESLLPPVEESRPDTSAESPSETVEAAPQAKALPPKPRFDFYTLLPEQRIDVDIDPDLSELTYGPILEDVKKLADTPVSEVMVPIKATVREDEHIVRVIYEMNRNDLAMLPVLRDDKVVGVVRSVDVFHEIAKLLLE